jgi:glycosyltransferase involved in cell wall biosynthesis
MTQSKIDFTVIIPVHNEDESVKELTDKISNVLSSMKKKFEIMYIDDGSTDNTLNELKELQKKNKTISIIELRRNYGKATALDIGFKKATGDFVVTMDGDLQDDPDEIPKMFEHMGDSYDLISGWKKKRHDPWHKTVPSLLFNKITSMVSGVKLHDFNCGFKMYRNIVVKNVNLYGEMHRYIPALAHWKGFRVGEMEVLHHARKYGKSKYGIERFLRGLFDFLTIAFITKYQSKPMHFFGKFGFTLNLVGGAAALYLAVLWFMREFFGFSEIGPIGERPLLAVAVFLIILGMLFFSTGLLAEMLVFLTRKDTFDDYLVKNTYSPSSSKIKRVGK